jgi:hypothetical protein
MHAAGTPGRCGPVDAVACDALNPWSCAKAPKAVRSMLEVVRRTSGFEAVQGGLAKGSVLFDAPLPVVRQLLRVSRAAIGLRPVHRRSADDLPRRGSGRGAGQVRASIRAASSRSAGAISTG